MAHTVRKLPCRCCANPSHHHHAFLLWWLMVRSNYLPSFYNSLCRHSHSIFRDLEMKNLLGHVHVTSLLDYDVDLDARLHCDVSRWTSLMNFFIAHRPTISRAIPYKPVGETFLLSQLPNTAAQEWELLLGRPASTTLIHLSFKPPKIDVSIVSSREQSNTVDWMPLVHEVRQVYDLVCWKQLLQS